MKTIEDLSLLPVPALQTIYTEITGNKPKASFNKAQLVQAVYEVQQPDASDLGATEGNGNNIQNAKSLDDAGANSDESGAGADDLTVNDDEDDLIGEAPVNLGPTLPAKQDFAHSNKDANVADIAKALAHLAISVHVDDQTVTLTRGAKVLHTTVKQPLHRIVAVAETFAH